MKSIKSSLLYGFFLWLIPFAVSFFIYPIRESNRPLFESIMPVVITASLMFFSTLYFKKLKTDFFKEGVYLRIIWLVINIGIDLKMFSRGPMAMSPASHITPPAEPEA